MYKIDGKEYKCSVEITNQIFNDKWKLGVVWHLLDGPKRYKDLNEKFSQITQKTLTIKLKELEEKKLVSRKVFAEVPPKVVYSLTPIGEELKEILNAMHSWGIKYVEECGEIVNGEVCESK